MELICNSIPVGILMDAAYKNVRGHGQLLRAVNDLRQDFAMVCGGIDSRCIPVDDNSDMQTRRLKDAGTAAPPLVSDVSGHNRRAIIIGAMSESGYIHSLMERGILPEAEQIEGRWEAYLMKQVANPFDGIEEALVIAGSDIRGTIYGIYNLSEYIGVSPWYWWSDVPVRARANLCYDRVDIVDAGPDVRYRGIFLNDEERLVDWSVVHFPEDKARDGRKMQGPNESIYRHFFEVLLRLGGNVLWPAMHEGTTAFNFNTDEHGISVNAKAADEYGIIMGSSHCEILLRNNVGEWAEWYERNRERYGILGENSHAAFDYTINKEAILHYWRERLEKNSTFEGIYVLGIRGVHDGAPRCTELEAAGYGTGMAGKVAMQKDVIARQRKLIEEVFGSPDAVPQVFIPYKEMNDYYNYNHGELASWLPEDIIIMYAEDNQGYLRQTTTAAERRRKGGCGVYYHNSYWGTPKSYLWLNSMPAFLMHEEMRKAYETGSDRYWILNVGDLKPGELGAEIFLRMAWRADCYCEQGLRKGFYRKQGMRDYGLSAGDAGEYAESMVKFSHYIQAKRPEFFGYGAKGTHTVPDFSEKRVFPFSITQHGDEGQRRIEEWNCLVDDMGRLMERMGEAHRDAFYEQVYHAVLSNRNCTEEYVYYWKNRLYAAQGRLTGSRRCAELSRRAVERLLEDQGYFDRIHGGKWNKMLNMDHIVYYQCNQGILKVREDMYESVDAPRAEIGAVCEGQKTGSEKVELRFDSLERNGRFIDVFSMDEEARHWSIQTESWIEPEKREGNALDGERIWLSVNWDMLPFGESCGEVAVCDGEGRKVSHFPVRAYREEVQEAGAYSEANGYVVVEAEHYTRMEPGADGSRFQVVKNLGLRGDSLKGYPDLADKAENLEDAAKAIYRIRFVTTGRFDAILYRLPTLNEGSEDGEERSCGIAVALDGREPVVLWGNRDTQGSWGDNVMRGYEPLHFTVEVAEPGYHDLTVYKVDASVAFERIVITTDVAIADDSLIGPPESPFNQG